MDSEGNKKLTSENVWLRKKRNHDDKTKEHILLWKLKLKMSCTHSCPVRRGVSAKSFDATGLGVHTCHVCYSINSTH